MKNKIFIVFIYLIIGTQLIGQEDDIFFSEEDYLVSTPSEIPQIAATIKEEISAFYDKKIEKSKELENDIHSRDAEIRRLQGVISNKDEQHETILAQLQEARKDSLENVHRIRHLKELQVQVEQKRKSSEEELELQKSVYSDLKKAYDKDKKINELLRKRITDLEAQLEEKRIWTEQGFYATYTLAENVLIQNLEVKTVKKLKNGGYRPTNKMEKWNALEIAFQAKMISGYRISDEFNFYVKVRNMTTNRTLYYAEGKGNDKAVIKPKNGVWKGVFQAYDSKLDHFGYYKFIATIYCRVKFKYPNGEIDELSFPLDIREFSLK